MSYAGEERRKPVDAEEDIKNLLMQVTDPAMKTLSYILLKVSDSVDHNTIITQAVREELRSHMDDEMKELSAHKGGLKVGLWALGIIQFLVGVIMSLVVYLGNEKLSDLAVLKESVAEVKLYVETHKEHHKQEERIKELNK